MTGEPGRRPCRASRSEPPQGRGRVRRAADRRLPLLVLGALLSVGTPAAAPAQQPQDGPPAASPPASAKTALRDLGGPLRALGAITLNVEERSLELPAEVNLTSGELEYALVHEGGKTHESLLRTAVTPFELNVALLLLHHAPAERWHLPPARPAPLETLPPASLCEVFVRWEAESGPSTAPLSRWVKNLATGTTAADGPFVYTGSKITEDGRFAADVDGTHIALYLDPRCLINNPRLGNGDDTVWRAEAAVPPKGTPVTVIIRPSRPPAEPPGKKPPSAGPPPAPARK